MLDLKIELYICLREYHTTLNCVIKNISMFIYNKQFHSILYKIYIILLLLKYKKCFLFVHNICVKRGVNV